MSRKIEYFKGTSLEQKFHYLWIADSKTESVRPENSYIIPLSSTDYEGIKITLNILYDVFPAGIWDGYSIHRGDRQFIVYLSDREYPSGKWPEARHTLGGGALDVIEHLMEWKPKDD
jgi:hypothetical protein